MDDWRKWDVICLQDKADLGSGHNVSSALICTKYSAGQRCKPCKEHRDPCETLARGSSRVRYNCLMGGAKCAEPLWRLPGTSANPVPVRTSQGFVLNRVTLKRDDLLNREWQVVKMSQNIWFGPGQVVVPVI